MELVSLQITFGKLVGFVQQPSREVRGAIREWYSVLYQETKEGEEEVNVQEFSNQTEVENWWREVSNLHEVQQESRTSCAVSRYQEE